MCILSCQVENLLKASVMWLAMLTLHDPFSTRHQEIAAAMAAKPPLNP